MEPHLPSPHSPEQGPQFTTPERASPVEHAPASQPERQEATAPTQERQSSAADYAAQAAPIIVPQTTATQDPPQPVAALPTDDNPATANDDDLIEKEWVSKSKKIINETRNDPHLQKDAFSRLQTDYLQKRFGKNVKLPGAE